MDIRTFVSFATCDASFVPTLLTRLTAQELNVWDYSVEGAEIPGGEDVGAYLRARIERSTLFLPIVSPNSIESSYTSLEVSVALARHREGRLKIIPLVTHSAVNLPAWGEPYSALRALRYYVFEREQGRAGSLEMEEAVSRICFDVGVGYVAPCTDTPRLPLVARMEAELTERFPRESERTNVLYARLNRAVRTCIGALAGGDHAAALRALEYFIAIAEYEYTGEKFYYPYVARAVCLIAVGRLAEAAQALTALRSHSSCEESVFGALGHIRQSQGLYAEAASLYREALRLDPSDAAAATGVVVNQVLSGERIVDLVDACKVVEEGTYLSEAERQGAQNVVALALARLGQSKRAAEIWLELVRLGNSPIPSVINLANVLVDMRHFGDAQHLLTKAASDFPESLELARWTTHFYLQYCDPRGAVAHARRAAGLAEDKADCWFDLLRAERLARDEQAHQTAERLVSMAPQSPEDFYYVGYANWVLGRRERADYDRERSGALTDYADIETMHNR